jgi:hypothetical protein
LHGGWWRWDASAGIVGSDRLELMLTLIWRGIKAFVQLHHFRPLELELDGFPSSLVSARRNPAKRRANALIVHFPQLRARLLRPPPRELGARPTPSASFSLQTLNYHRSGLKFLVISRGFSGAMRTSQTGLTPKISLRMPAVSFRANLAEISTYGKVVFVSIA